QEADLFAHGGAARGLVRRFGACGCGSFGLRRACDRHRLRLRRNRLGLNLRCARRGSIAVEIRDSLARFGRRHRRELVADRTGQSLVRSATTTAAAARPPFALTLILTLIGALIGAGLARHLLGFLVVGLALVERAGGLAIGHGRLLGGETVLLLARRSAMRLRRLARFATPAAAPPPAPLAPRTILLTFAVGGSLLGEPFGFLGFDLGFTL